MTDLLAVGTRIVFTKTISEAASGDHPAFLMASEGETGWINGHTTSATLPYSVYADSWPQAPFLAQADEFLELKDQPCST